MLQTYKASRALVPRAMWELKVVAERPALRALEVVLDRRRRDARLLFQLSERQVVRVLLQRVEQLLQDLALDVNRAASHTLAGGQLL